MKRITLFGFLFLLSFYSHSQVKDISVTVAPTAEYTWWDNETILQDSPLIGGRIGFGFGRFFEIRGLYMKSMDLKGTLEGIKWEGAQDLAKDLQNSNVDIVRWGGEMKANLGLTNKFSPYITLGTGVQNFQFHRENQNKKPYKEEQIFVSAGLGLKFNLSNRVVLALEGRNTMFNVNEENPYLKSQIKADKKDKRAYNWSALASLEFYLGGRNPEKLTDLDIAYRNSFKGGFKGMRFLIDPGMMYVSFDEKSPFSNTYFLGASAGVDLTQYIGIRGFYYKSTKNKELSFDFDDKLSMYGGNIIARLNENTGVTPYLSVGGGYLDVAEGLKSEKGVEIKKGSGFAMGGLGLEIPISKYILLYGSANYLLTASEGIKAENITNPSELHTSMAYKAGIRIQLGRSADDPKKLLEKRIQEKVSLVDKKYESEITNLKLDYKNRIERLNEELEKAYSKNDVEKAVVLLKEKKKNEEELKKVSQVANSLDDNSQVKKEEMVRMSRNEFEELVREVIRTIDSKKARDRSFEIDELEDTFLEINKNTPKSENADINAKILKELVRLNKKIEANSERIGKVSENQSQIYQKEISTLKESDIVVETPKEEKQSKWKNEGFSVYTGPSFGKDFAWNLGLRSYHHISGTKHLKFMPEAYYRFGGNGGFGISGNVIYQFNKKMGKIINPYAGLGIGLFKNESTKLGSNIIIGTELNVLKGKLFVDYSARNLFKNNQIAVGYKLLF